MQLVDCYSSKLITCPKPGRLELERGGLKLAHLGLLTSSHIKNCNRRCNFSLYVSFTAQLCYGLNKVLDEYAADLFDTLVCINLHDGTLKNFGSSRS